MAPLFNNVFFPSYLLKSAPGSATTGTRSQNDVLYCPSDNWHRAYEAATPGVTNLIGYNTLPFRTVAVPQLFNFGQYNTYGFGQWFTRTKVGGHYRNAPVMADDIEIIQNNDGKPPGWTAVFTGAFNYIGPASSHAGNGNIPRGGNFLFEDSHVEWIKFVMGPGNTFPTISQAASGAVAGNIYFLYPVQCGKGPW